MTPVCKGNEIIRSKFNSLQVPYSERNKVTKGPVSRESDHKKLVLWAKEFVTAMQIEIAFLLPLFFLRGQNSRSIPYRKSSKLLPRVRTYLSSMQILQQATQKAENRGRFPTQQGQDYRMNGRERSASALCREVGQQVRNAKYNCFGKGIRICFACLDHVILRKIV